MNIFSGMTGFLLRSLTDARAQGSLPVRQKTLLIVRLDLIGDYLLFRNFLKTIRTSKRFSGFRLTLCGNSQFSELAETLDAGVVDEFLWIDRTRFLSDLGYRLQILRKIASKGYEVAFHASISREFYFGDAVIKASRAPIKVGCANDTRLLSSWQKKISDRFYTRLIPTASEPQFEFVRERQFLQDWLEEAVLLEKPSLDLVPGPKENLSDLSYAVIFPGAGVPSKRWSPERFGEVGLDLLRSGVKRLVIAGGLDDAKLASAIMAHTGNERTIDLTGKTSLVELAGWIRNASLVVCNDTCAVHFAALQGTPVVCIVSGDHLGRYLPYPEHLAKNVHCVFPPALEKNPEHFIAFCRKYRNRPSPFDINTISSARVRDEIVYLLKNRVALPAPSPHSAKNFEPIV